MDLSRRSLELARTRAEVYGFTDVEFYQADAEKLSEVVPPARYDLVYSFGVIHHTPNPGAVLEQIRDHYVDSESEIKLMVYHKYATKVLGIVLKEGKGRFWRLDELVARHSEANTGCPVTYTYSRAGARSLLKDFKILDLSVDHIFPYVVADYVQYRYKMHWYYRFLPTPVFSWLERRFGWHLCVSARTTMQTPLQNA